MHKVRVHEIAKELGLKSKEVVEKTKEIGLELKAASSVNSDIAEGIVEYIMKGIIPKVIKNEIENSQEEVSEISKNIEKQEVLDVQVSVKLEEKEEKIIEHKKEEIEAVKEDTEESLAQSSIMRRRVGGIKIIKKNKVNEPKEEVEEIKLEAPLSTSQIITENKKTTQANEELRNADKSEKKSFQKQKKKTPPPSKHTQMEKIDFQRDLSESSREDESEDEVVLLDFSIEDEIKKENDKLKNIIDEKNIKITKKTSFLNQQGIKRTSRRKRRPTQNGKSEDVKVISIPENIRVYEFAEKINKTSSDVIKVLFNLGMMVNKNDFLEGDYIEILADEFGLEVHTIDPLEEMDYIKIYDKIEDTKLVERPPVITIMGHVDHGKTSLLDKIRNTKIADKEAGGITQHIGAYIIEKNGKKITFLDTPGHEAFTAMRARGTKVTDIVIIVVAADDGVKPQTIEAISHAKAAGVPIIVAINKIDKADANLDRVKSQMADQGLTPIDWGGEYEFIPVSAYSGAGIEDLLETILIQAEVLELKANPKREAKAVVVESSVEKGQGASATVIVQNGTLEVGNVFVVDTTYGRVRTLTNDLGKKIKKLEAGEPGVITGFNDVPTAGSVLIVTENEKDAKEYAQKRADYFRQKGLSKSTKVTFDELGDLIAEGKLKALPIILKADVQGSLEAIKGSLEKLKNEEVKINIIHSGVGAVSESDVTLASASENTIVLGFNVRPSTSVSNKAKILGVEIKTYSIIYNLLDDVKSLLSGLMAPTFKEEISGQAEVRDTFTIAKVGTIAGCMVIDGVINRNAKARVIRDGVVIYTTTINSLKRFKDDAREVSKGYECGIMLDNFNDLKVNDVIEIFKEVEQKASV